MSKEKSKENQWKDFLLKSGIPLEYEVLMFLESKQCQSNFEYSYFRNNENNNLSEFSYDIDSSYIEMPHWFDLMIECKYRHESTKWVFLPAQYGGPDEIGFTSFMHSNDHFTKNNKFILDSVFPYEFAPLCSKGIELTTEGPNPKTITQAVTQLSYAMPHRITNGFYHQTDSILSEHFREVIFYNIPIIITTAELYRLKEGVKISEIKKSNSLESIAEKRNSLVMKSTPSLDLEQYSSTHFQKFLKENDRARLIPLLNSFNVDIDFVMSVIAKNYSPSCIVVLSHNDSNSAFEDLFKFMNLVINPSQEVFDAIRKKQEDFSSRFAEIISKNSRNNNTPNNHGNGMR